MTHPLSETAKTIAERYPWARKIIEVGVGWNPQVAKELRKLLPEAEIILVDKNPEAVEHLKTLGFKAVRDDIINPDHEIYMSSTLIYSIHPPPELIPYMIQLAEKVGADLLIKPLSEDAYLAELNTKRRVGSMYLLVSHGEKA